MTMIDLDDLEAKARAATPGPWSWWTSNSYRRLSSDATGRDGDVLHGTVHRDGIADIYGSDENRAHIAAANPAAILETIGLLRNAENAGVALIKERDALEAEVRRLRAIIREATHFIRDAQDILVHDLDEDDWASGEDFLSRALAALEPEPDGA